MKDLYHALENTARKLNEEIPFENLMANDLICFSFFRGVRFWDFVMAVDYPFLSSCHFYISVFTHIVHKGIYYLFLNAH